MYNTCSSTLRYTGLPTKDETVKITKSQIKNNTDKTLDIAFFKFKSFSFTITLKTEAQRNYAQAALNYETQLEHPRNSFGLLPQGYCELKPLNLAKTTSSVLILI